MDGADLGALERMRSRDSRTRLGADSRSPREGDDARDAAEEQDIRDSL